MPEQFEYDVFLSHASTDKPAVRKLAERLKGDGLRVWLDEWVIQPGDSIPLAIERGLESSQTLVLAMSQAAFDSEWVTLERHTALFRDPTNQHRRCIPLRLDDAEIRASLKQFAYVDWRTNDEVEYKRLLGRCRWGQISMVSRHPTNTNIVTSAGVVRGIGPQQQAVVAVAFKDNHSRIWPKAFVKPNIDGAWTHDLPHPIEKMPDIVIDLILVTDSVAAQFRKTGKEWNKAKRWPGHDRTEEMILLDRFAYPTQ